MMVEPDTVSSFMARQHLHIDQMMGDLRPVVADGEWERADELFRELGEAFLHHMEVEDYRVWPAFVAAGGSEALIEELRADHAEIAAALARMFAAIQAADAAAYASGAWDLDRVHALHTAREESSVYPVVDRSVVGEARARLLAAVADYRSSQTFPWTGLAEQRE